MGLGLYLIWWFIESVMCFLAGYMASRGQWGICITLSLLVVVCAIVMTGLLIAQTIKNRKQM